MDRAPTSRNHQLAGGSVDGGVEEFSAWRCACKDSERYSALFRVVDMNRKDDRLLGR